MKHVLKLTLAALLGAASAPLAAQSMDERVESLERRLDSSVLIDMAGELQRLRQEVQTLRGDKEVLQRQLSELREQQRALYNDVDNRLRTLESAPAQTPSQQQDQAPALELGQPEEGADGATEQNGPSGELRDSSANDPGQAYQRAYRLLVDGRHEEAGQAFAAFLEAHPDHQLSPNAWYWLGESHYVVREFDQALPRFQAILEQFPDSNKTPDAMLKIAFIHFEKGDLTKTREQLQTLIEQYPDSAAAALGRQRLERMRQ